MSVYIEFAPTLQAGVEEFAATLSADVEGRRCRCVQALQQQEANVEDRKQFWELQLIYNSGRRASYNRQAGKILRKIIGGKQSFISNSRFSKVMYPSTGIGFLHNSSGRNIFLG